MGILANENAISSGGYQISNSLRFQSASSQYLSRTPSSAGNQQKHTISVWTKYSTASADRQIISFGNNTTYMVYFGSSGTTLNIGTQILGVSNPWNINTTQVFRDPSAWYHIVVAVDTTQATAANRVKVYVNGTQVTAISGTYPTLNYNTGANTTTSHSIGRREDNVQFYDGYLAEFNWIDGQALTPSSFGETNTLTGQWVAKKYTGTYGTNGFYLPFSNGTSTTTLGADSSGNGNNWTLTNFTRSAGVSDCWMYDVPSGNGSSVGGTQPSSNYAVMNPLILTSTTLSQANLKATKSANGDVSVVSTIAMSSGKYYWECYIGALSGTGNQLIGVCKNTVGTGTYTSSTIAGFGGANPNEARKYGTSLGTVTNAAATNTLGFALDMDAGTLAYYINNTLTYTITGLDTTTPHYAYWNSYANTDSGTFNFGQRSFAYTPPSGFKALCTANLPVATIVKGNQYMDATLYTGNGSTQTITNAAGFSPDLVWIKIRSTTGSNVLSDVVRGTNSQLFSNLTDAEQTRSDYITAFNSNGFSLGAGSAGTGNVNSNGATFVGWQWDAGSSTVTNTSGSISSQVRANTTAGVSIVTYTTQASGTATVGHGLGVAPKMIITKSRSAVNQWVTYHASLGNGGHVNLNTTAAYTVDANIWNNTSPTSSVFTLGTSWVGSFSMVAYCFAEIAGFSKFGIYTGNGSADGPFVYCGFRPKFVMVKNASSGTASDQWLIKDSSRNTYNVADANLYPSLSNAEDTASTAYIDLLSNGFKVRGTYNGLNGSTNGIIYMAFAENPFAQANAR